MASLYSIAESDITPARIPANIWDELTDYDNDGTQDVTPLDVIEEAEAEFNSYLGGMFTVAANIALARPQVMAAVIYHFHARRQQNSDYIIPESIEKRYQMAIRWANANGARLLAAEGSIDPPGAAAVEYDAPTTSYSMDQLDTL